MNLGVVLKPKNEYSVISVFPLMVIAKCTMLTKVNSSSHFCDCMFMYLGWMKIYLIFLDALFFFER